MSCSLSRGSPPSLQMEAELCELKDFREMSHIPVLTSYIWKKELATRLVMLAGKNSLSHQTGQSPRWWGNRVSLMVQHGATYLEGMEGNTGFPLRGPQHLTEQYLPPGLPLVEAASVRSQRSHGEEQAGVPCSHREADPWEMLVIQQLGKLVSQFLLNGTSISSIANKQPFCRTALALSSLGCNLKDLN